MTDEPFHIHGHDTFTGAKKRRLLLAHLARLDARVEKANDGHGIAEALAGAFADAMVKLEAGERVPGPEPVAADRREPRVGEEEQEEVPLVEAALRWLEAERTKRGLDEGTYDDDPWGVEPLDDEPFDGDEEADFPENTAGENSPP